MLQNKYVIIICFQIFYIIKINGINEDDTIIPEEVKKNIFISYNMAILGSIPDAQSRKEKRAKGEEKMKKYFCLMLAALLLMALVSCASTEPASTNGHGTDPSSAPEESQSPFEPVILEDGGNGWGYDFNITSFSIEDGWTVPDSIGDPLPVYYHRLGYGQGPPFVNYTEEDNNMIRVNTLDAVSVFFGEFVRNNIEFIKTTHSPERNNYTFFCEYVDKSDNRITAAGDAGFVNLTMPDGYVLPGCSDGVTADELMSVAKKMIELDETVLCHEVKQEIHDVTGTEDSFTAVKKKSGDFSTDSVKKIHLAHRQGRWYIWIRNITDLQLVGYYHTVPAEDAWNSALDFIGEYEKDPIELMNTVVTYEQHVVYKRDSDDGAVFYAPAYKFFFKGTGEKEGYYGSVDVLAVAFDWQGADPLPSD